MASRPSKRVSGGVGRFRIPQTQERRPPMEQSPNSVPDSFAVEPHVATRLRELARNLWWTWQPNVIQLFRDLDPGLWRDTDHNPVEFLRRIPPDQLEHRAAEMALHSRIDSALRRLNEYLHGIENWAAYHALVLRSRPVAYFSMEFGLHESLPIYSGGLGVLAGDHLKSASDLGVPLVGVGILYNQGYFRQSLDSEGRQQETYASTDTDLLPIRAGAGRRRAAGSRPGRYPRRNPPRPGLEGRRRPDHPLPARLQRPRKQRGRPQPDRPPLRWRRPDPDPPGTAPGHRRPAGPPQAGNPPLRPAPERRA